ncbi:UPF0488 protein CG14286 [Agrilus planipennis]|uniref:UPF0488 protein CG14286 n=1 Tax=Agrilus planipennis TaxID=224129 RepID=A0A1W4WZG1_AGRPL|nr:UPF0488 protein CG14286 [Agrilus planipennis]
MRFYRQMPPSGKNKNRKIKCAPSLPKTDHNLKTYYTCTSNNDQEELKREFEVELCWCIEQLQKALKAGKLNKKQVQDHVKALNTLMSSTTPVPQKRQVMRLSFGDYRAKMVAEEKKYSGKINAKIVTAKPDSKSTFVRKSVLLNEGESFKFNFDALNVNEDSSYTHDHTLKDKDQNVVTNCNHFKFIPSNSTFKFSFNID